VLPNRLPVRGSRQGVAIVTLERDPWPGRARARAGHPQLPQRSSRAVQSDRAGGPLRTDGAAPFRSLGPPSQTGDTVSKDWGVVVADLSPTGSRPMASRLQKALGRDGRRFLAGLSSSQTYDVVSDSKKLVLKLLTIDFICAATLGLHIRDH
jgi:hypothetical protein